MFRRLTAVGAAPASIILFMLFLAYLQPLDADRLVDADAVRTGRLVLMLLPYGLAALGLGIGSPVLTGLSGSLVVTAPQMMGWAGDSSLGLVYSAATLMVLVGLLESVFKRAYRDALTGLPGRRDLDDALRHIGRR